MFKRNEKHNFEKYIIVSTITAAKEFIDKLEAQNINYEIKLGTTSNLGEWIKISYEKGYKPF